MTFAKNKFPASFRLSLPSSRAVVVRLATGGKFNKRDRFLMSLL
jgi:hypothetical protein